MTKASVESSDSPEASSASRTAVPARKPLAVENKVDNREASVNSPVSERDRSEASAGCAVESQTRSASTAGIPIRPSARPLIPSFTHSHWHTRPLLSPAARVTFFTACWKLSLDLSILSLFATRQDGWGNRSFVEGLTVNNAHREWRGECAGEPIRLRPALLVLFLLLCTAAASAQEFDHELSLDQLMQIEITTASKCPEPETRAPAIMTVVPREEILSTGAASLADFLDLLPSIEVYSTFFNQHSILAMRGDISATSNNHVLFLINGRPFRESLSGSYNRSFLSAFPLSSVRRIEIIRGPASVLYGANAYMGVINIITESTGAGRTLGDIRTGMHRAFSADVSSGTVLGPLSLDGGIHYARSDGWPYHLTDAYGVTETNVLPYEYAGASLTASTGPLSLTMFGAVHTENIINLFFPVWSVPPAQTYREQRLLTDLTWRMSVTDGWTAEMSVTHNLLIGRSYVPVDSARDDLFRGKASDIQAEVSSTIRITSASQLVVGALSALQTGHGEQPAYSINQDTSIHSPIVPFPIYQRQNPAPLHALPVYNETWNALYAQANVWVLGELNLVAGMQLHKLSELPATAVFRGGAVYANSDGWSGKLLFAQAFRPASAQERKAEVPGSLYGNEYLKPERVRTFEGQISYLADSYAASATIFDNAQRDLITTTRPGENIPNTVNEHTTPPGVPFYINRGSLTSRGFELESIWSPSRRMRIFVSYTGLFDSYIFHTPFGTDTNVTSYFGMPRSITKFGFRYHATSWLTVGIADSWYARFADLSDAPHLNPSLNAFHDVTLLVRVALPESLLGAPTTRTSLFLQVSNLLDDSINFPEYSNRLVNTVPGRDRRTVSVGCAIEL